jgi:hypothetical protein
VPVESSAETSSSIAPTMTSMPGPLSLVLSVDPLQQKGGYLQLDPSATD